MITSRAYLFGFVGFCFYLIAIVNALPTFYYALTWLTAAILASSLGAALLSLLGLSCHWRVSKARVSETLSLEASEVQDSEEMPGARREEMGISDGPLLEFEISNDGSFNKTDILLQVSLHEQWRDEIVIRRSLLAAVPAGQSFSAAMVLRDLPRGRYHIEAVQLVGSDVLGLFRTRKRVEMKIPMETSPNTSNFDEDDTPAAPSEQEIIVGPAMLTASSALLHLGAGSGEGSNQARRSMGQSDEVRGTRPYVAGDDLRFVHWKSTARHGELVVREFHRSLQHSGVVIWDGASGTNHGLDEFSSREQGLRLVASLCRTFSNAAQRYALLRLDSRPLWVAGMANHLNFAATLPVIIDTLADADAARNTPLPDALQQFLPQIDGAEVFLITASLSPAVAHTAALCQARGARVSVGLIDGAAYLEASDLAMRDASYDLLWRPPSRRAPREKWQSSTSADLPAGEIAVTRNAYQLQENALRERGIAVTRLALGSESLAERERVPDNFDLALSLRAALHGLLDSSVTANATASTTNATSNDYSLKPAASSPQASLTGA